MHLTPCSSTRMGALFFARTEGHSVDPVDPSIQEPPLDAVTQLLKEAGFEHIAIKPYSNQLYLLATTESDAANLNAAKTSDEQYALQNDNKLKFGVKTHDFFTLRGLLDAVKNCDGLKDVLLGEGARQVFIPSKSVKNYDGVIFNETLSSPLSEDTPSEDIRVLVTNKTLNFFT